MSLNIRSDEADVFELQRNMARQTGRTLSDGALVFLIKEGIIDPPEDVAWDVELIDMDFRNQTAHGASDKEWDKLVSDSWGEINAIKPDQAPILASTAAQFLLESA